MMGWNQFIVSARQGVQSHFGKRPMQGTIILPNDKGNRSMMASSVSNENELSSNERKLRSWMKPVENEAEILWILEEG